MNYNELFNVVYSDLPESVKISILDKIPSDFITEELNESSSEIGAYVELLDTLAYSSVSEATVEDVIDEVFSNLSADTAEEVLEAYMREKVIQYLEEAIAHGTDAIGLAGMKRERAEREAKAQKVQARREAFNRAKSELIHKGAELSKKAVTGAREATQNAIHKGAELSKKAVRKGAELSQKANDIRNTVANKAGEYKDKAISGIKNAVGKVRDWAKKATTVEPSAKDLASAIGRKAIENEKEGKPNFKPNSYADRYAKSLQRKANATNSIKAGAETTKGAQAVNNKPTEVKTEEVKNNVASEPTKEPEQQKLNLDFSGKSPSAKIASAKKAKEKVEAKKEEEVKPAETSKVEAEKEEEVKSTKKRGRKKKAEVNAEEQQSEVNQGKQSKTQKSSKIKANKEKQPEVAEAPKVESKEEPVAQETESKPSGRKINVNNFYTSHGLEKPSAKEKQKQASAKIAQKNSKNKEENANVETANNNADQNDSQKVSAVSKALSKTNNEKSENKPKEDEIDKIMNSSKQRTAKQQKASDKVEDKRKSGEALKNLERDVEMLEKEIMYAKNPMQKEAKQKQLEEKRKKLEELRSAQPAHEALADLAYILVKTNISEEAFVEIMTMTNPIKRKENKKKKFEEIAKKRFKKD